jgi:hypothetical protein
MQKVQSALLSHALVERDNARKVRLIPVPNSNSRPEPLIVDGPFAESKEFCSPGKTTTPRRLFDECA